MQPDDLTKALAPMMGDRLSGVEPFAGTAGRVRFRPEAALDLFRLVHDQLGFHHLSMVGDRLGRASGGLLRRVVG